MTSEQAFRRAMHVPRMCEQAARGVPLNDCIDCSDPDISQSWWADEWLVWQASRAECVRVVQGYKDAVLGYCPIAAWDAMVKELGGEDE